MVFTLLTGSFEEAALNKSLDVLRVFSDTLVNLLEENRGKHSKPKHRKKKVVKDVVPVKPLTMANFDVHVL